MRHVHIAIIQCSLPGSESLRGEYLYLTLVGNLAAKMKPKKLVLTHMYSQCEGREELMLIEAKKSFS